eukprot:TRINITY_DN28645_c0_g1_i1.p1 TRINITY_DN28645_c0_g1~~TRINITY_DN28645_c0_g1_i1.p1  ORF type:complete len:479 (+),score=70.51 TRINITY_DN28645_c0_g1_i1:109-1545(+)
MEFTAGVGVSGDLSTSLAGRGIRRNCGRGCGGGGRSRRSGRGAPRHIPRWPSATLEQAAHEESGDGSEEVTSGAVAAEHGERSCDPCNGAGKGTSPSVNRRAPRRGRLSSARQEELTAIVAAFVESPETQFVFPATDRGLERKFLHEVAVRHGCTAQAFGRGRDKYLGLFKGNRFQEGPDDESVTFPISSACVAECSDVEVDGQLSPESKPTVSPSRTRRCKSESGAGCGVGGRRRCRTRSEVPADADGARIELCAFVPAVPLSPWQEEDAHSFDVAVGRAYDFLPLPSVLCASQLCRSWASLSARVQVKLPPVLVDAVLQFCLLDVLVDFDDARIPLPMSAIYGEMCAVAKKTCLCPERRARLEMEVFQSDKKVPAGFFEGRHPRHVHWSTACKELSKSSFKTLEKLGRHFNTAKLIEVRVERWRKTVHHTPNTRSCKEWLLINVNRSHPLYLEHAAWREHLAVSTALRRSASDNVV